MARILVIDDDPGVRRSVESRLRSAGYVVMTADSGERGFEAALGGAFDVVLSDLKMPGMSGIEVLSRLRERQVDAAMIIMTAFGTVEAAVEAMKLGAVDFIQKPFLRDELLLRVKAATERRQLARHVQLLQRHVHRSPDSLAAIVGTSAAIEQVRCFVRRAAAAMGTVLITGETGTGKELVARAIHAESSRRTKPFVPVNCSALAESVLESELFGHARGAFTGAVDARAGLIEHADGGVLFLDEAGAMPKTLQAKLLRVFESGEIRRVGENDHRTIDARIIAATNTDLNAAMAAGEFRQDLFYRLNVLHVRLPSLRERRREDILVLADHFLERYGGPAGVTGMSEAARDALARYGYPGNVRQLEHIVQRAVAVAQGASIDLPDLSADLTQPVLPPAESELSVASARDRAERQTLVAALEQHEGDLSSTARHLRVSRTTLWRMLRKHDLREVAFH